MDTKEPKHLHLVSSQDQASKRRHENAKIESICNTLLHSDSDQECIEAIREFGRLVPERKLTLVH